VITIIVGAVDGQYAEGIAILIAIFLATTLAFVNEYRAQREFDVLNASGDDARPTSSATALLYVVQRKELVVGDIVLIEGGDEIPADGWVREAVALQVQRGAADWRVAAGGETASEPVVTPINGVASSRAARWWSTGTVFSRSVRWQSTKIGEIAREATTETDENHAAQCPVERLSKLFGVVGFGVAALTYARSCTTLSPSRNWC